MRITRIVPPAVRVRVLCVSILIVGLLAGLLAVAQTDATSFDPMRPPQRGREPDTDVQIRERMQREADKQWNKQRQAALKKDTDKLLELATQLKQQVDKSNESILSLEVIKKADEIEKLARSVREKMRARSY
ncbi:MAG: hypothetical protein M3P27_03880 [Acidobacteriota bacterium]|nr:hypothetical protein [Acidobacteriota bacterium]